MIATVSRANRHIAYWLIACAALVFAMVVLGGVTRLTRSGLSIVEWQPLVGAIPPLTEADWLELFAKYQQTPEYQKVNVGMDLEGFKGIFWLEYLHRLLGRAIGIVFLVPFLYFLIRRQIERPLVPKLVAMFVLGGLQGLMGWLMVASGLVDVPRVSPYRLTAHLALAIIIYAYMLWVALGLLTPGGTDTASVPDRIRRKSVALAAFVFFVILTGGFVAGTRAGFAFNDWPLMFGYVVPPGMYALEPWWVNLFENVATVQFNHRLVAYLLIAGVVALWWMARRANLPARVRTGVNLLVTALALQVALGIATLIYIVPLTLAAAHQAGALLLFTAALYLAYNTRRAG